MSTPGVENENRETARKTEAESKITSVAHSEVAGGGNGSSADVRGYSRKTEGWVVLHECGDHGLHDVSPMLDHQWQAMDVVKSVRQKEYGVIWLAYRKIEETLKVV